MFSLFNVEKKIERKAPKIPSITEASRLVSWRNCTCDDIMSDPVGRQVFRCFLHECLAEENLMFVEEVEKLKKEKDLDKVRKGIQDMLDKYDSYINLSNVALCKLKEAAKGEQPAQKALETAYKEVYKFLELDQFPRFRRSDTYQDFVKRTEMAKAK
ncbi:RGS-3 protein [Aphelenchoides avenae]|nr:RGS-3 protein [Aphelenchus avenae]